MAFYNPFVCDFEFNAANFSAADGVFRTEAARCNHCESLLHVDANVLKEHVTLAHGEELPPAYFKAIIGLDAHIPGRGFTAVKPSKWVHCCQAKQAFAGLLLSIGSRARRKTALMPNTITKQRTKDPMHATTDIGGGF